jgi:hypothetical protein
MVTRLTSTKNNTEEKGKQQKTQLEGRLTSLRLEPPAHNVLYLVCIIESRSVMPFEPSSTKGKNNCFELRGVRKRNQEGIVFTYGEVREHRRPTWKTSKILRMLEYIIILPNVERPDYTYSYATFNWSLHHFKNEQVSCMWMYSFFLYLWVSEDGFVIDPIAVVFSSEVQLGPQYGWPTWGRLAISTIESLDAPI